MRLRSRFRLNAAISLGVVLLLSGLVGWSFQAEERARAEEKLARDLQQEALERRIIRDEYLLHPEARSREQMEVKTARLEVLVKSAGDVFRDPVDRGTLGDLARNLERSSDLFKKITELPLDRLAGPGVQNVRAEHRARLSIQLLRLSHETHGLADRLASSAEHRAEENWRRTLVIAFVTMGASLAVTALNLLQVNRLLERRISLLRDGAEHVSSGNLDHRVAIAGDDELADLARAFDAMTTQLQKAYRGLEASNRELEAFSYSVSHDLRAPLRHVTGFVELLRESAPKDLDPKSVHYLDVISKAATRMGVLIDDLLAFSRFGRVEMKRGLVSLQSLVEDVVRELAPTSTGREVVWEIGPLPDVTGDEAMLRQLFRNLVGNAVKFSRPRKAARISIGAGEAGPGEVEIHVRDNGVGFDMKYADKLFNVFQRLHSSEEFEGTGVGLAIVHRIVQRHGGRLRAEGVPDGGATFWVSLPIQEEGS
jgi:signal transduction histidine kinase